MRAKIWTGLGFTAAGLGCVAGAGYEGLHYSSWANPAALGHMVQLGGAALVLFCVPAAMTVIWFARQWRRAVKGLGLTPGQTLLAQLTLAEIVQQIWAEHNEAEARRLTASVMGPVRGGDQQWPGN